MPKTKADIIKEDPLDQTNWKESYNSLSITNKTIKEGYNEASTEKKPSQITEQMKIMDRITESIIKSLNQVKTKLEPICLQLDTVAPLPSPQDGEHQVPYAQYLIKKNAIFNQFDNDLQLILESIQI